MHFNLKITRYGLEHTTLECPSGWHFLFCWNRKKKDYYNQTSN